MKAMTTALGAAVMAVAFAAPAAAEYVRLGSADVSYRTDGDTVYSRFGGRLESLRLIAGRSDIYCRSIVVQYESGDRESVFSGRLDERQPVEVNLRDRARRIDSIRFACRSDESRGGRIFIEGDVGHFREEWRRDRDWDRNWAALFGSDRDATHGPDRMDGPGQMGGPDRMRGADQMRDTGDRNRDWFPLGRQTFQGRNDRESSFTDWNGRHVDRIALRALETDAQCMSIVATFDGGRKVKLADGRTLERGRITVYDLPGSERNITKVYLRCRALDGYRVTIEILARR